MLKRSFSLVLLMLLMGVVVSLAAQEPSQGAVSPLTGVRNDLHGLLDDVSTGEPSSADSVGGLPPSPADSVGTLGNVGNDVSLGGPFTLYQTYAKYSNTPVVVGSGYRAVDDGTTFTCPESSCLVEFDEFVQISGAQPGESGWSICAAVDGNYVNTPNCPSLGSPYPPESDYIYTVGSFIQFATVSSGAHTLQTFVYSQYGLTKDIWSLVYRIYTP